MDEQDSITGVWREALAIIRRYPSAVIVPGAVLGALAEAPAYLIVDRLLLDQLLTYLSAAFAHYLYLAYAEGLTTDYERGRDLIVSRNVLGELLEAMAFVPRVLVAALITVSASTVAAGLLVLRRGHLPLKSRPNNSHQAFKPFGARFSRPFRPVAVRGVYADGDTVVVVWDGEGTRLDGKPYENSYAWIMRFREGLVVEATAFFDSIAFDELWSEVTPKD
jgi:ketosteroid isomerase-like protein